MNKKTSEIRQEFIEFFSNKEHQVVESSSLIPKNDSTLLFTNAGMNQFKNVFLGIEKRTYQCATTSQRCIRAGGKHNDLEHVGYTNYHHTFFEMLGNFSFGAYFKYEAIQLAWELLTSTQWFNISKQKLLITVHNTDYETYDIWLNKIGVAQEHIIRIGDHKGINYLSDNFWQMGDTGPCGPCTEIFYNYNDNIDNNNLINLKEHKDNYIEIWNLVFMQFNRQIDGTMIPLPQPVVDTGMGLERIVAILQNVKSNYDIDLFKTLINAIVQITNINLITSKSLCVIADHIRASTFLISDGVLPSNEGRGYVLRKIIRRAIRHGNILGIHGSFLYKLVTPLIEVMESISNQLRKQKSIIEQVLRIEEEQFAHTLIRGMTILNKEINKVSNHVLSGNIAFKLYDTYGFPLDLTIDICREKDISVDISTFNFAMNVQRKQAQQCSIFGINNNKSFFTNQVTHFIGYEKLNYHSTVILLFRNNHTVTSIQKDEEGIIVLDKTAFYAESGGQVGDQGTIESHSVLCQVIDTKKYGKTFYHFVKVTHGKVTCGMSVVINVNKERRKCISLNHSATHLLHTALRKFLGKHIQQKGSFINNDYLRFDFSHNQPINYQQICLLENFINEYITNNVSIQTNIMSLEEARSKGAIALFNEKYEDQVRVVCIENISIELCGGTHAKRTGDIGLFHIIKEHSISTGVRRIEAITGNVAIKFIQQQDKILHDVNQLIKSNNNTLLSKVQVLLNTLEQLKKDIHNFKNKQIIDQCIALCSNTRDIKGVKVLINQLEDIEPKVLDTMVYILKNQLGSAIILLTTVKQDKINLIVGVTKNLIYRISAQDIMNYITQQTGIKGGGRSDLAQAGGINNQTLPQTLMNIDTFLIKKL